MRDAIIVRSRVQNLRRCRRQTSETPLPPSAFEHPPLSRFQVMMFRVQVGLAPARNSKRHINTQPRSFL